MITGSEFRRLREETGMTQQDVASFIGCDIRSPRRWEAGKTRIPDRVVERLEHVVDMLDVYAKRAVTVYFEQMRGLDTDEMPEVALVVYDDADADMVEWPSLPFHTHAAAVGKAFDKLRRLGVPVRLVKMDRADYYAYLAGRPDTQAERSSWAAIRTTKDKAG